VTRPLHHASPRARPGRPYLNNDETECVQLAAAGLSFKQIATRTFIPFETVRWHLRNARLKLGARNVVHTATLAMLYGYVTPEHLRIATAEGPTP
jgi:DNA-binding CsgD family transcriptional regulator